MKKACFRILALVLTACFILSAAHFDAAGEGDNMDVEFTVNVTAWEKAPATSKDVTVFVNDADEVRVIKTFEYNLKSSRVFVFNSEGLMVEAGENLYGNEDTTNGSPQTEVNIPAHGFMVTFGGASPVKLTTAYSFVTEGVMFYNSTITVVRKVYASLDRDAGTVTVKYNKAVKESENCISFLFVGNSTTYFNAIPLKFRAMCAAAGIEVSVTYCTFGSAYLSEFANPDHERGKALRSKLNARKYDYVVLQDAGGANFDDTRPALDIILPLVYENGATPLLYMRYSSTSDDSARTDGAIRHYRNYLRLSKLYGIKYSPVAVAFEYCRTEHREINLYASDNSHHSKEGSYLAAATMMYSFLGVSPVGNSYTAYLPQDVVDILQAEAAKAVETEFELGALKPATLKIDGEEYFNAAFDKPYTATGKAYSGTWTDTGADGKPLGKFTDGLRAGSGDEGTCGCYTGQKQYITIDLGDVYSLRRVDTDLFGGPWGIASPSGAKVSVEYSIDGKKFRAAGDAKMGGVVKTGGWDRTMFVYTSEEPEAARYVRLCYELGSAFSWISEIQAFAKDKSCIMSAVKGAAAAADAAIGRPGE